MHTMTEEISIPSARLLTSCLLALAVTFALFALMQKLISSEPVRFTDPGVEVDFNVFSEPKDSAVKPLIKLPPPPKMVEPPKTVPATPADPGTITDIVDVELPPIAPPEVNNDFTPGDRAATPIVRSEPAYPPQAARDGITGWVRLRFDIDVTGRPANIQIVDAEPKRVFEQSARQALKRWKYQPQIADGKPIAQPGQEILLSFDLDSVTH